VFVGRQWLYQDMLAHLAAGEASSRGVVVTGTSGCGKTALLLQLVEGSCFGRDRGPVAEPRGRSRIVLEATAAQRSLASQVVSFHFCQADNSVTCLVGDWVHSLAAQLAQAPALAAYHELLSTDHSLRTRLSLPQCTTDPHTALTQGVLGPLAILRQAGKISGENCIVLIDGLCNSQFHRPDYGDTLAAFVARHLESFPTWLKLVVTVRSDKAETVKDLPFLTLRMDGESDERPRQDLSEFVFKRISSSESLLANITPASGRPVGEGPQARLKSFQKHLADAAKGCFLFVKLTLDLIERGHLVLKSSSFNLLPLSLSEVFLLEFNLKFPSLQSFRQVSDILSVALAALQPLTMVDIHQTVSALSVGPAPSWTQFLESFRALEGYLVARRDQSVMFFHPLFREWLIRRGEAEPDKFVCDPRTGHAALALRISRQGAPVDGERTLELTHHLLKAHLYRHSTAAVPSRDLQSQWIGLATEEVSEALGHPSNLAIPNMKVSRLLLLSGASPDFITPILGKAPLLCVSAHHGHTDMVSLLLEFGADIAATNKQGVPALGLAAAAGRLETVCRLVESGAMVSQRDAAGACPLVLAARAGHLACLEQLVSCDWPAAAPDLTLVEAAQQAAVAAAGAGHVELLEFLLDLAAVLVDSPDSLTGLTPLCAAAAAGRAACCEALLRRGAGLGTGGALLLAAREGHWSVAELLLKAGAEVGQGDPQGRTPLMVAAMEDHLGVVELLAARGAELEQTDAAGMTALMAASARSRLQVVELLLGQGAVVTAEDGQGRTALDFAAEQGEPSLVQALLDSGADLEHMDVSGLRPLDRAIGAGNTEVVACFLRRGAKLGPSTWTAAKERPEILVVLLNKLLEDGNTLFRKQKVVEAAQRYSYASKRIPTECKGPHQAVFLQLRVHLLLNLSRCKRKQLDHSGAAQLASEALSLAPSCPEALHARAKASHAAGRLEDAARDLTEAVRVAPQNRDLHKILLALKLEMKEASPAVEPKCVEARRSVESSSGVGSEGSGASGEHDIRRATLL
jgi:ankyrin repeat protein